MTAPLSPSPAAYPSIRLLPKVKGRGGGPADMPWVYSDELVLDRRTRKLEPGDFAILQDAQRAPLAVVTVNPNSKICARVLDPDPAAVIDSGWMRRRVERALSLRSRLYDRAFYRLIHAEADGLPGVVVDRFGDTLVLQPNAAWAERCLPDLTKVLVQTTGASTVLKSASGRARALEGLDDVSQLLQGEVAGLIEVEMNGAIYMADVQGGQKTGLFYDQRDNHAFAARLAGGGSVLDVFSHVGGFSLAALARGAGCALAVDGSERALELAQQGARASGFEARFSTRRGDGFKVMEALFAEGARFDMVVADPPAFAPSKQVLGNGLTAYARVAMMAARLVNPGGFLVLCSCSHAAGLGKFRQASLRGIARAGRAGALLKSGAAGADHPTHPALAESGYLKSLFFRLD